MLKIILTIFIINLAINSSKLVNSDNISPFTDIKKEEHYVLIEAASSQTTTFQGFISGKSGELLAILTSSPTLEIIDLITGETIENYKFNPFTKLILKTLNISKSLVITAYNPNLRELTIIKDLKELSLIKNIPFFDCKSLSITNIGEFILLNSKLERKLIVITYDLRLKQYKIEKVLEGTNLDTIGTITDGKEFLVSYSSDKFSIPHFDILSFDPVTGQGYEERELQVNSFINGFVKISDNLFISHSNGVIKHNKYGKHEYPIKDVKNIGKLNDKIMVINQVNNLQLYNNDVKLISDMENALNRDFDGIFVNSNVEAGFFNDFLVVVRDEVKKSKFSNDWEFKGMPSLGKENRFESSNIYVTIYRLIRE